MAEQIVMTPIAHIISDITEVTDDYWGGTEAIIRIDDERFTSESLVGLEDFSHLEVVFHFHLTDKNDLHFGARPARNNPAWPATGYFAHRNMRKINWIGVSRCRLIKIDGMDLHVAELDAVDGTPVLDVKPWFPEFGPRGEVRSATWATEMLSDYFAPTDNAASAE
ncbi:SAM-dependent methyltransferase [Catenulispora yoronensis]|uniref:SAM-dependent methyltransferase n=1 Tax=Catenulispora yoronensis TaxID=450799 RepID=UPI00364167F2